MYRQLRKWWKTWGTIPILDWVKAAALFRKGQFGVAEKLYRRGLKKHPQHVASFCARLDLAYCLFRNGKLVESESELKYVTVHMPEMKEAHLRLARLQLWKGHALDAAWTVRRALRILQADEDLAVLFLSAVIENGGPWYLVDEAEEVARRLAAMTDGSLRLEACLAMLDAQRGKVEQATNTLLELSEDSHTTFECQVFLAKLLLDHGQVADARKYLRQALAMSSEHPQVMSLLARSYLISGPFYNAEFAKQLATTACQRTDWSSPREMHILAEAYYHSGDKISALVIASKAKDEGSRLLGSYRDVKSLDQLIENLSTGTQA